MITSSVSAVARVDYYSHEDTDQKHDLWDGDIAVDKIGYLTELLGERARRRRQWLREGRPAVSAQPALQCAALAVGSAGR